MIEIKRPKWQIYSWWDSNYGINLEDGTSLRFEAGAEFEDDDGCWAEDCGDDYEKAGIQATIPDDLGEVCFVEPETGCPCRWREGRHMPDSLYILVLELQLRRLRAFRKVISLDEAFKRERMLWIGETVGVENHD